MKNRFNANGDLAIIKIVMSLSLFLGFSNPYAFGQCNDCPLPYVYSVDACTCRESSPDSEGNATNLTNGQFTETLVVAADSGQDWIIAEVNGFFSNLSPQPPFPPLPFEPAFPLLELEGGLYILQGLHIDEIGYNITLTNGTDSLIFSNQCAYPNPVMDLLAAGYCETSTVQELNGSGGGAEGLANFDIFDTNTGNLIVPDASFFDPQALGLGDYAVQYTFNQEPNLAPCLNCEPGCIQTISQQVEVAELPQSLECNDFIQISLDEDCSQELNPDLILEGMYDTYTIFEVHIFNGLNDLGNIIDGSMIDLLLTVQVTNTCDENVCWGQIQILDKLVPIFDCPLNPYQLSCVEDPATILPPLAIDNCDLYVDVELGSETIENFDCATTNGLVQLIVRKWKATDDSGNEAEPCSQIIEIQQAAIEEIVFPADLDGPTALDCGDDEPTPAMSGYPTIGGLPLIDSVSLCFFNVTYNDIILPGCGESYKILRKWNIFNWCDPSETATHSQLIHLADFDVPIISCPDSIVVSIDGPGCLSNVDFPWIDYTDACSLVELYITGPLGVPVSPGQQLENVPAGIYQIEIEAIDACGNSSECLLDLQVVDASAPVAICDEFTTIALDQDGVAELPATELDDGSYDFCTAVTFAARRMDTLGDYLPWVAFDCADIGQGFIQVELQVSDAFSNVNFCMIQVEVEDKLAPQITCPESQLVDCNVPFINPEDFGIPEVLEPCDYDLTLVLTTDTDACGVGSYLLFYEATDASGNQASCSFIIESIDTLPFSESDILWPLDFEASSCDSMIQLLPDSLPSSPENYGYPILVDNDCSLNGMSYEDAFFDLSEPACFKVVRTWSVIDWCQFNPDTDEGIWTYEQVISVTDNEAPEVFCAFSTFVKITGPFCYDTVTLNYPYVNDCSPLIEVEVTSDLGEGFGPFPEVALGNYDVEYVVTDQCGNSTICSYTLYVVDAKKPTPVCMNGLVAEISQDGTVDVNVNWLNLGSYDNCTAPEDLIISFSSISFADTVRTYTCEDIGAQTVQMWVFDEPWNADYCEVDIFIQDNLGHCSDDLMIAGQVTTVEQEPVAQVQLELNNNQQTIENGLDGLFGFSDLATGEDYTVRPSKDINYLNGVSTYDMLLISLHILGISPLDTPYKLIAADVNNSGTISTLDALEIQKLILLQIEGFSNNDSWRFVDASYDFPNPGNPFDPPYPEVLSYNNLTNDILDADFIGVKIGDVNGSADPLAFNIIEDRTTTKTVVWDVYSRAGLLSENEQVVEIKYSGREEMFSWQQTVEWDPAVLELNQVEAANADYGLEVSEDGKLNLAGIHLGPGVSNSLYRLSFTTKQNYLTDLPLTIVSSENAEFRNAAGMYFDLKLRNATSEEYEPMIFPNPTNDKASIHFPVKRSGDIIITITDLSGQIIWKRKEERFKETIELELPIDQISSPGIYFVDIVLDNQHWIKRLVILDK